MTILSVPSNGSIINVLVSPENQKGNGFAPIIVKCKILSLSIVKVDFHYHWGTTLGDKLDSAAHTVRMLSINA